MRRLDAKALMVLLMEIMSPKRERNALLRTVSERLESDASGGRQA